MKMPFPGMDPYLEHPLLWGELHLSLAVQIRNQLNPRVRPRYVVSVETRVIIEGTQQERIPDVLVNEAMRGPGGNAGLAVAEAPAASPVIVECEPLRIRQPYMHILDRYRDLKVVTVIEVVSPSNKSPGPGRRAYRKKQRENLASECHLVEIDLLRRGRHVLAAAKPRASTFEPYDYLISVNRWPDRTRFELYPCGLRTSLPRFRVPLAKPDPDVILDLQDALEQVYQLGGEMLRVKYDEPCVPPLSPEDQAWAYERWAAYKAAHPEWFGSPQTG